MWSALKFHICVCVCLCLYVCVYLCVCICAYPCVYVYVCVHVCVYLCGGQGLLFHQWSACPGLPSHPLVSLQSHEGGSVGAPLSLHRSRDGITVPSVVFAQSKDIICDFWLTRLLFSWPGKNKLPLGCSFVSSHWWLTSSAHVWDTKQRENSGYTWLCHSSGPEFPSQPTFSLQH